MSQLNPLGTKVLNFLNQFTKKSENYGASGDGLNIEDPKYYLKNDKTIQDTLGFSTGIDALNPAAANTDSVLYSPLRPGSSDLSAGFSSGTDALTNPVAAVTAQLKSSNPIALSEPDIKGASSAPPATKATPVTPVTSETPIELGAATGDQYAFMGNGQLGGGNTNNWATGGLQNQNMDSQVGGGTRALSGAALADSIIGAVGTAGNLYFMNEQLNLGRDIYDLKKKANRETTAMNKQSYNNAFEARSAGRFGYGSGAYSQHLASRAV